MKYSTKKHTLSFLLLCLCVCLCLSLTACKDYDAIVFNFYRNTCGDAYNAIELNLGENNFGIYYIEEEYGIWHLNNDKYLFDFDYVPRAHRGGELMIFIATQQSYYKSIIQQNNGFASFYRGKMVFSGSCEFSDNETVATISPDRIYINEMFIDPNHTVVMTKTSIPDEDIVPFDIVLDDMNFVPDTYMNYTSDRNGWKFSCKLANLWVDGSTMTGEWSTNGSIIPIRMDLHEKVPYVEIYDISGPSEKLILKSYANVIDEASIELVDSEGTVFYTASTSPVIVTKTN